MQFAARTQHVAPFLAMKFGKRAAALDADRRWGTHQVRLSYTAGMEELDEALARIGRFFTRPA